MAPLIGTVLITSVGVFLLRLAGIKKGFWEQSALGWLCGSAVSTMFVFWYLWLGPFCIPMVGVFIFCVAALNKNSNPRIGYEPEKEQSPFLRALIITMLLLTALQVLYGALSTLYMSTDNWDAFNNWHLRARYFFETGSLGVDDKAAWMLGGETTPRHYPIHLPLLKAILCTLNGGWSDTWAFFPDIAGYISFLIIAFCNLRRISGLMAATIAVYLVSSIPIVSIHLSAGLADLSVAFYLGAAGLYWNEWRAERSRKETIALAAFLLASAAWTKYDALFLYLPILAAATFATDKKSFAKYFLPAVAFPLLPWITFKELAGLSGFGPSEVLFGFHPGFFSLLVPQFLHSGGFGLFWPIAAALFLLPKRDTTQNDMEILALSFLAAILALFAFTSAFQFLENNMTFQRSLMQIAPLFAMVIGLRAAAVLKPAGDR